MGRFLFGKQTGATFSRRARVVAILLALVVGVASCSIALTERHKVFIASQSWSQIQNRAIISHAAGDMSVADFVNFKQANDAVMAIIDKFLQNDGLTSEDHEMLEGLVSEWNDKLLELEGCTFLARIALQC